MSAYTPPTPLPQSLCGPPQRNVVIPSLTPRERPGGKPAGNCSPCICAGVTVKGGGGQEEKAVTELGTARTPWGLLIPHTSASV